MINRSTLRDKILLLDKYPGMVSRQVPGDE